jgi:hypothetical protein
MAFRDRVEGQDVSFEGARRRDSSGQGVTNEELRDCFECPVCFEVPRSSPIFACSRVINIRNTLSILECLLKRLSRSFYRNIKPFTYNS